MNKPLAIAAPLLLFVVVVVVRIAVRRPMTRRALNIHSSVLLLVYVSTTAGLGVFWVANQQLPVFDLHYLFGYATMLLVATHLTFNFGAVVRHYRRMTKPARTRAEARPVLLRLGVAAAFLLALGGAFALGARQGKTEVSLSWSAPPAASAASSTPKVAPQGPTDVVARYHELSAHSRFKAVARAQSVDWGDPPPPFKKAPGRRFALSARGTAKGGIALDDAWNGPHRVSGPLDLAALGAILHHAAGVTEHRGGLALRASPSSGALFSSELYVVARDVEGLGPGTYHYDPEEEALVETPPGATVLAPIDGDTSLPATIVVSAIFRRTGIKYRDRAYRYVAADAGHLLENIRLAAADAGFFAQPERSFDEVKAARAIAVDGVEEGVVAVVPLRRAPPPSAAQPAFAFVSGDEASRAPLGITSLVHLATSLRRSADSPEAALRPDAGPPRDRAVALPAAVPATAGVLATIGIRRSRRNFLEQPIALTVLSSVLRDAAAVGPLLSRAVRLHVIVNRVEDLAPGVYRFDPRAHALETTRAGDLRAEVQASALAQEAIGGGAVVFVWTLDRDELFLDDGARGYRHGFLETGMMGERILLSAQARGLGACPVGAFYDDEASALLAIDPAREWVVHYAAMGMIEDAAAR